ncbi:universal stress protein [Actinocorallia populi]|uniref:universal stress protein n=1 Tax=Actinocorallia populi TaxID=2079200 RepID=UPI000D096037|nr:universal stress protein [Actinocorallia populi]
MNEISPEPVIVGTDGSPASHAAVAWAADEALRTGRPLRIVHVQEPWTLGLPDIPPPMADEARAVESREILDEAAALAAKGRPELTVQTENIQGETVRALRLLAERGGELVLGSRGRGRFAELLLGSTTLRVAGHAARPVVVVRGEPATRRGEIVVGVAFDHDPTGPLTYAFEAARRRGSRLRAVHAWDVTDTFARQAAEDPSFVDPLDRLTELLESWRVRYPDVKVAEEIVNAHPAAVLSESSADADLLVVGTHGRGSLGSLLLGSVGHAVLHHARCPVVIVPV